MGFVTKVDKGSPWGTFAAESVKALAGIPSAMQDAKTKAAEAAMKAKEFETRQASAQQDLMEKQEKFRLLNSKTLQDKIADGFQSEDSAGWLKLNGADVEKALQHSGAKATMQDVDNLIRLKDPEIADAMKNIVSANNFLMTATPQTQSSTIFKTQADKALNAFDTMIKKLPSSLRDTYKKGKEDFVEQSQKLRDKYIEAENKAAENKAKEAGDDTWRKGQKEFTLRPTIQESKFFDQTVNSTNQYDTTLTMLQDESVQKMLKSAPSRLKFNILSGESINNFTGGVFKGTLTPEQVQFKREIEQSFQAARKIITGAQASDKELKTLRPNFPSTIDTPTQIDFSLNFSRATTKYDEAQKLYRSARSRGPQLQNEFLNRNATDPESKQLAEHLLSVGGDYKLSTYLKEKFPEYLGTNAAGGATASGEVTRTTKDGKRAVFDVKTKKFLRYE